MRYVLIVIFLFLPVRSAMAVMPEPPQEAIQHQIQGYGDEQANVYIWHDSEKQLYIKIIPLTDSFSFFDDFAFIYLGEACEMYLYDEYGTHVYGDLSKEQTFYLRFKAYAPDVCADINVNAANILRYLVYGSPIYTTYPNEWFTGVPPQPMACDCIDTDEDGVPDSWDQCPGTPPGQPTDGAGCPVRPKTTIITVPLN